MFQLNNSDITILATVCVVNLFCAGLFRHVVLFNSGFVQRRILFEGLSLLGFLTAIVLSLFSVVVWVNNPSFVIACTLLWASLCLLAVVRIWRGHRSRLVREVLEIPEFWNEESFSGNQLSITTGKIDDDSTVAMPGSPAMFRNESTPLWNTAARRMEIKIVAQASHSELSGNGVRDKLDRYKDKRAYKSAVISNLSAYRQRSNAIVTESLMGKTACQ